MENIEKIKIKIEKFSNYHVSFRSSDYRAYDYFIRKDSRDYILKKLYINPDKSLWNKSYLRYILEEHMRRSNNHDQLICDILQIQLIKELFLNRRI
jgi:hypothetical protein